MATLKIREYSLAGSGRSVGNDGGLIPIADESSGVTDQPPVSFTSTHGVSAAFSPTTWFVGIEADVKFCFKVGAAPVATQSMLHIAADTIYFFAVRPGAGMKVSAVAAA